jgi:hypothetical protein
LRLRSLLPVAPPRSGWRLPAGSPASRTNHFAIGLAVLLAATLAVPAAVAARPSIVAPTPSNSVSPDFIWEIPQPPDPTPPPAPEPPPPPPAPEIPVFAHARGLALTQISPAARAVGYHQAGRSTRSVPLTPVRPSITNGRPGAGPWGLIQPSRRRGTDRASAVDIALPADVAVHSPVTGRVAKVERYRLYRRIPDLKVTIIPDDRPHAEVVLLHVARVPVVEGDRVIAGETVVAKTARPLPLRSAIERYSGKMPHVHLEVRPSATIKRTR